MLPLSFSDYFDKWNKTCLPILIAFSSLPDINTTLKNGITIKWSFTLRYVIATTSLWCWKKISYNDVTSMSIRNGPISRCKFNKNLISPQYRVPVRERKISILFLHISDLMTWIPCPKIDKFYIFISSHSRCTWHYLQRVLIWLHIVK